MIWGLLTCGNLSNIVQSLSWLMGDDALISYCSIVTCFVCRLPGEAQIVTRVLELFSQYWLVSTYVITC